MRHPVRVTCVDQSDTSTFLSGIHNALWRPLTVPRQTRVPQRLFAERLDRLFRTVHPKDRGPYTHTEVVEAIDQAADDKMASGTYLWLLRTWRRDNPTAKHIIAIARFFGVPPTCFLPDDAMERTRRAPNWPRRSATTRCGRGHCARAGCLTGR
jgi:hypothetical protein